MYSNIFDLNFPFRAYGNAMTNINNKNRVVKSLSPGNSGNKV